MYQNNKQVGRVRINKINEGRLRKKTHVQKKTLKKSRLHVLLDLQNKLFKEGLNHMEYCKYTQTKINDNKYHYRGLSENDFIYLKDRNEFVFDLPSADYLVKSKTKNSYKKEVENLNKVNSEKLEKVLSEYGVDG